MGARSCFETRSRPIICAQRLSATLMGALHFDGKLGCLHLCSTPFGDIDGCTRYESRGLLVSAWCSTPFGDIDGCTAPGRSLPCCSGGAQRLSATLMGAQGDDAITGLSLNLCSTPFGDIDGCTPVGNHVTGPLKACSTPFGDIDGCTNRAGFSRPSPRSAQRLSATLMGARGNQERLAPGVGCAQRLSATLMGARSLPDPRQ